MPSPKGTKSLSVDLKKTGRALYDFVSEIFIKF